MVAFTPDPDTTTPPGLPVNVQAPVGSPLKSTLPVGVAHEACVIGPIMGASTIGFIVTATANLKELSHPPIVCDA
jgi:hypothetical protein